MHLRSHGPQSRGRGSVEEFIRRVYAARYGADVRAFAPTLVSLVDGERIVAAAGYRPAALGPLFLERYLPAPVEALLPRTGGAKPRRRHIVEVGHLASDRFGQGVQLIRLLGNELAEHRYEWVVSTVTQELRRLFVRLQVVPHALGAAEASALGDEAEHWGSYYEHRPVVLAGRLAPAMEVILRRRSPKNVS
jgi:hypothetical protein